MFWDFLGPEACGIIVPSPGLEPTPSALESKVLTTGLPGKSHGRHCLKCWESYIRHCLFLCSIYRHLESVGRDRLAETIVEFSECYAGGEYEVLRSIAHSILGIHERLWR